MWRISITGILILSLVLGAVAWLGGCSDEPDGGPVAPDKAYLGDRLDIESLVDTYILDGEVDSEFPEDPQVYPYYIVRHGPEAGTYSFSAGDTVPDRAYAVFKARTITDEPTPQRFTVQGHFTAGAPIHEDGPWFPFFTTYSPHDLKPTWYAPHRGLAADTVGFEVGPFSYDVAMRGILNLSENRLYRDPSAATLSFQGNYEPCIQAVELINAYHNPEDLAPESECWQHPELDEETVVFVYHVGSMPDPRYAPWGDPQHALYSPSPDQNIWINPTARMITYGEPADPGDWMTIPAIRYRMLLYLHGRDHLQEMPPPNRMEERIAAWKYQIDHAADPDNLLSEGPGPDDIDQLFGFPIQTNDPDPTLSDVFITDEGVWALALDIMVPMFLILPPPGGGPDSFWNFLRAVNDAPPRPDDPAEWPAWQQDPAVQLAYTSWELTTMSYGEGSVSVVACDQTSCDWNDLASSYHFYAGTRIPTPNGRSCQDYAYEQQGIVELGNVPLEDFTRPSNGGEPLVKGFRIIVELMDGTSFEGGDPPGWIPGRANRLSTRTSRE